MIWSRLASPALRGGEGKVAVWPIGATEQHGPHLPSGTDFMIAEAVCAAAVSGMADAVVLPALSVGCSGAHTTRWPGTLSLMPRTFIGVVVETADWIEASGWSRLLLVNGHVGNWAPLKCAVDEIRQRRTGMRVGLVNTWDLADDVGAAFRADGDDWHANQAETSIMMAMAPTLVGEVDGADDVDRTGGAVFAWNVAATSRNGVTGSPSRASAEQGRVLLESMVKDLRLRVARARQEEPPLAGPSRDGHASQPRMEVSS